MAEPTGGAGGLKGAAAVEGDAASQSGVGVRGTNPNGALGLLAAIDLTFNQPAGVYGQSNNLGVVGVCKAPLGAGVLGAGGQSGADLDPAKGGTGVLGTGYIGVRGETTSGVAILGRLFGPGRAGRFEGDVDVTGDLSVGKDLRVTGDVFLANAGMDLAEQFALEPAAACEPGMLMVIGERGAVAPCAAEYDKRAIGIVSGAGSLRAAITLGDREPSRPTAPIALMGTAFCWVDADRAPITAGDLLTSSGRAGHAMRASDPFKSFGAVIGKALASLASGQGLLPVLIALQ
ncbi:MAG: hypothetical protein JO023_05045 [Chloroflexi bacterium]|nr:hypothetical protein [Chloroflexota bacterium]